MHINRWKRLLAGFLAMIFLCGALPFGTVLADGEPGEDAPEQIAEQKQDEPKVEAPKVEPKDVSKTDEPKDASKEDVPQDASEADVPQVEAKQEENPAAPVTAQDEPEAQEATEVPADTADEPLATPTAETNKSENEALLEAATALLKQLPKAADFDAANETHLAAYRAAKKSYDALPNNLRERLDKALVANLLAIDALVKAQEDAPAVPETEEEAKNEQEEVLPGATKPKNEDAPAIPETEDEAKTEQEEVLDGDALMTLSMQLGDSPSNEPTPTTFEYSLDIDWGTIQAADRKNFTMTVPTATDGESFKIRAGRTNYIISHSEELDWTNATFSDVTYYRYRIDVDMAQGKVTVHIVLNEDCAYDIYLEWDEDVPAGMREEVALTYKTVQGMQVLCEYWLNAENNWHVRVLKPQGSPSVEMSGIKVTFHHESDKKLVIRAHRAGVSIITDWGSIPKDERGFIQVTFDDAYTHDSRRTYVLREENEWSCEEDKYTINLHTVRIDYAERDDYRYTFTIDDENRVVTVKVTSKDRPIITVDWGTIPVKDQIPVEFDYEMMGTWYQIELKPSNRYTQVLDNVGGLQMTISYSIQRVDGYSFRLDRSGSDGWVIHASKVYRLTFTVIAPDTIKNYENSIDVKVMAPGATFNCICSNNQGWTYMLEHDRPFETVEVENPPMGVDVRIDMDNMEDVKIYLEHLTPVITVNWGSIPDGTNFEINASCTIGDTSKAFALHQGNKFRYVHDKAGDILALELEQKPGYLLTAAISADKQSAVINVAQLDYPTLSVNWGSIEERFDISAYMQVDTSEETLTLDEANSYATTSTFRGRLKRVTCDAVPGYTLTPVISADQQSAVINVAKNPTYKVAVVVDWGTLDMTQRFNFAYECYLNGDAENVHSVPLDNTNQWVGEITTDKAITSIETAVAPTQEGYMITVDTSDLSAVRIAVTMNKVLVDIPVSVVWNVGDAKNAKRPASLSIPICDADGNELDTVSVSQANGWKAIYPDLPYENADGTRIAYTIKVPRVSGFSTRVKSDSTGDGFVITYSLKTKKTEGESTADRDEPDDTLSPLCDDIVPLGGNTGVDDNPNTMDAKRSAEAEEMKIASRSCATPSATRTGAST